MFRTMPEYELPLPPLFRTGGAKSWQAFQIVLHNVWFLCEYVIETEDGDFGKVICLGSLDDALNLANVAKEHRINIVIPANQTASGQIEIRPVTEIHRADEDGQRSMTIFVAPDGARFVDSLLGVTEDQATNKEIVYLKKDSDYLKRAGEGS